MRGWHEFRQNCRSPLEVSPVRMWACPVWDNFVPERLAIPVRARLCLSAEIRGKFKEVSPVCARGAQATRSKMTGYKMQVLRMAGAFELPVTTKMSVTLIDICNKIG